MWIMAAAMQATVTPLPAGVENDLKCMAAISLAAPEMPADRQGAMGAGMMYFLGRIDHAAPTLDFTSQMKRLIAQPGGEALLRAELPRCSAVLHDRSDALLDRAPEPDEPR
ncbi:hypothetical protein ASE67_04525 [Sphingomonas sp. Leaf23]|nr:hypothetical protein ASE67_04525 [Sphingomonas sp. Leaf23]